MPSSNMKSTFCPFGFPGTLLRGLRKGLCTDRWAPFWIRPCRTNRNMHDLGDRWVAVWIRPCRGNRPMQPLGAKWHRGKPHKHPLGAHWHPSTGPLGSLLDTALPWESSYAPSRSPVAPLRTDSLRRYLPYRNLYAPFRSPVAPPWTDFSLRYFLCRSP